jgi:hypothetical protein
MVMTDRTEAGEAIYCPFCGERNAVICNSGRAGENGPYAVSCQTQDCHGAVWALGYHLFKTEAEAITAWNRRANESGRPLEWNVSRNGDWRADTPVGEYAAGIVHGDYVLMLRRIVAGQVSDEKIGGGFREPAAAKAAAQAHHDALIRSALTAPSSATIDAYDLAEAKRIIAELREVTANYDVIREAADFIEALTQRGPFQPTRTFAPESREFIEPGDPRWRDPADPFDTEGAAPPSATIEGLRKALEGLVEILEPASHPAWRDPQYGDRVEALGREIGFGALISSASASWREAQQERDGFSGGEFVVGPCFAVLTKYLDASRAALKASEPKP